MRAALVAGVAVVTVMASGIPTQANSADFSVTMGGNGNESCGSWTEHHRHGAYTQWVLGFISGAAWKASSESFDPLAGNVASGGWAWIDNYCATHQIDKIVDAAEEFMSAHPRAKK